MNKRSWSWHIIVIQQKHSQQKKQIRKWDYGEMTTYFIYLFLYFMSHAMVTVRYPGTEVQWAIENMGLNTARYTQTCYEIQMLSMAIIINMTTEERLCKSREEKIQKKQDNSYVKSQTAAQSGSIHSRAGTSRWQT